MRFFRRKVHPVIYRGEFIVAPTGHVIESLNLGGALRGGNLIESLDMDSALKSKLEEYITPPNAPKPEQASEMDWVLDVMITDYRLSSGYIGAVGNFDGEAWWLLPIVLAAVLWTLVWRPKLRLSARLYSIKTSQTISVYSIVKKPSWRSWLKRLFQADSSFNSSDRARDDPFLLLGEAILALMRQVQKKVAGD